MYEFTRDWLWLLNLYLTRLTLPCNLNKICGNNTKLMFVGSHE
uniref:Uncharacterized protein n=1 Tax=Arundo donax TaxID=35708 RepID=A0A0A9GNR1_ARUDO